MSEGAGAWAVKVYGSPAPKGSMKCIGRRGKAAHNLINNSPGTEAWQTVVAGAARVLKDHHGIAEPLEGPLGAQVTFTVARPKSIKPAARPWPHLTPGKVIDGGGDIDKLLRTVFDGLEEAGLIRNDAQICVTSAAKVYADSDLPDVLHRPGAFIRLYRL